MQHGNHEQRCFLWRVSDQVFTHNLKAQLPRSEIRAAMTLVWERDQERGWHRRSHLERGPPNLGCPTPGIPRSLRYLDKLRDEECTHSRTRRPTLLTFPAQASECILTVKRLDSSGFNVIVPAVESLTHVRDFLKITRHRILDQVVGRTPRFGGQLLQTRFCFRPETYFHACQCRCTEESLSKPGELPPARSLAVTQANSAEIASLTRLHKPVA